MGDPAGVGPEICLHLLLEPAVLAACTPVVFGNADVLARVGRQLRLPLPTRRIRRHDWPGAAEDLAEPAVLDVAGIDAAAVQPGVVDATTGRVAHACIEMAIEAAMSGQVDAVVTGPIHKEAMRAAGVPFPGHTELFAARTQAERFCMMLTCDQLTCTFVTTHVGYRDVPGLLTRDRVLQTIEMSQAAMRHMGIVQPRLVACGLNPHAGEHGLFGDREEERVIAPAIEKARSANIDVIGPLPPDTAFLPERRRVTDCFVCMYHDQGHIPLKALAFDVAVNVTLGLPIIRTSVDHGTALDIAWQGRARATSLVNAVRLATRLASVKKGVGGLGSY
jgi:4-hydroxythreonine-4-phosphate dehydrogenase